MSSSPQLVQYIADQLSGAGNISYRKMFGEYGMYCNGKIFALVCGDMLLVKITDAGRALAPHLETAAIPGYSEKKFFLVEDIDDRDFLINFVTETCRELPEPKPKRQKPLK